MKGLKTIVGLLVISMMACMACTSKTSNTKPQQDTLATVEVAPQVLPVTVQMLNGYFLKNTYKLSSDTECILFTNQASFDLALGVAKTMNNKIDKPDFEKNIVAGIALKPAKQKTNIVITKAEKAGEMINVYAEVTIGEAITYTMQPFAVFCFPKEEGVNALNFIVDGKVIRSFPLNVPATN